MKTESIKALLDACYQAKRIRELLPALPEGVSPSYIQYLDVIEHLAHRGVRVKISDISDALNIPRPGVTRTVKEMVDVGYLQKKRFRNGRARHLSFHHRERRSAVADLQRAFLFAAHAAAGRRIRRGRGLHNPHD